MATDRTLDLLRHAKAEPEGELGDQMRTLAAKGRTQATAIGPRLRQAVGGVDLALVSAALRTRETYKLLRAELGGPEPVVSEELYQAGPRQVLGMLQGVEPGTGTVLVVGHEPTISGLAYLLHDMKDSLSQQVSLGVATATACVLRVPTSWAELDRGSARLVRLVRAAD